MLVKSFAKINLSIDVGPRGDNGYHRVDMVMQQLSYHDDVTVEYVPSEDKEDEESSRNSDNMFIIPHRGMCYCICCESS